MVSPSLDTTDSTPGCWNGEFITFQIVHPEGRKTPTWMVLNRKDASYLGGVSWFPRWRKYVFTPEYGCVFEEVCLGDISQFIIARTREHKRGTVN